MSNKTTNPTIIHDEIDASADGVFGAIRAGRSARACIFKALSNAFKGSTTIASNRCGLIGGIRKAIDEFTAAQRIIMDRLNDEIADLGESPDKDAVKVLKTAAMNELRPHREQKNRDLSMIRIYAGEWLREQQYPTIASGVKPSREGLAFSLEWDEETDEIKAALDTKQAKPSQAGKGKGRKAKAKAGKPEAVDAGKGRDKDSKAYGAEAALRDAFEDLLIDPTDDATQKHFAKQLETYRKEFIADQKAAMKSTGTNG